MRLPKSDSCNTVEYGCLAPPADPFSFTRAKCFRCGEAVCTHCSLRRPYLRYGRRRICGRCYEEIARAET